MSLKGKEENPQNSPGIFPEGWSFCPLLPIII
jgi:hypothetical protein